MNVTLLCPADAPAAPELSRRRPLVLAPFLGRTVLEHVLSGLAAGGAKHVRIEASDRVEEIRDAVGRGEAWGIGIGFSRTPGPVDGPVPGRVVTLDRLPQLPDQPLWRSYRDWFAAQRALIPVMARQRVGMRETAPGVFVGLRSQIAEDARLLGPCWVGANVFVGSRAVLGPDTIIEDGSYIDDGAEITGSVVGPRTYVGAFTELRDSSAWGDVLLSLGTGSVTAVPDRFLLGELQSGPGFGGGLRDAVRSFGRSRTAKDPGTVILLAAAPRARLEPRPAN